MSSHTSTLEFLAKQFCSALEHVFVSTSGEAYQLERSATAATHGEDSLGYWLEFSGSVHGAASVRVSLHSAAVLAGRLLGTASESTPEYEPEHEDAVFEIINQTAGEVANQLRQKFGAMEIRAARKQGNVADTPLLITLRSAAEADDVFISLQPDQELADSIAALPMNETAAHVEVPLPPVSPADEHQNLQLIMDVELDLTLRFGQRSLMLSEIADLTTGSVVELDRVVDEPVELLLGDRVIARGEVVIVDGNYGLRVTELAAIDHRALMRA